MLDFFLSLSLHNNQLLKIQHEIFRIREETQSCWMCVNRKQGPSNMVQPNHKKEVQNGAS